jgi:hypothetical protein
MTTLRFVIAFKTEAMPVIGHFGLKKQKPVAGFPVFRNDQHALILSGPGKAAAISATNHLYKLCGTTANTFWLNFGVAGHPDLPLGTVVLAGNISESDSETVWTTQQSFATDITRSRLITVNKPETEYRQQALYDMEAAGFYAAALQYAQADRVQCLKVVSDNKDLPVHTFSTRQARKLIQQAQPDLLNFIDALLEQDIP